MTRNSPLFLLFIIFLGSSTLVVGQDIAGYNKSEIKDLSQKVEDQVKFLEYFLNTVGSKDTPARDKDVIIRESYMKIFRDGKVQVEDDLLLDRKVITNKDITAYLKDIEFFFRDANFKFRIREVKPFERDNGELSFLVSMDRTLEAIGLNKEKITNTRERFIEVNVDKKSNELKIASMYTTKLSRDEELLEWWRTLSFTWESYFRSKVGLSEEDSVTLDHLYKISSIDSINLAGNQFVVDLEPIEALRDLKYIDISNTRITELNPISNVTFLTYLNISNTATKDIQFIKYSDKLTSLDISNTQIQDLDELGNLKQLHTLRAVKTPIMSFGVLNSFESLRNLNLSESGFNNVENISELTELKYLDISNNYLINFEMLSLLENLEEINLQETNIADLSPLTNLQKLRVININQTEVTDISPLNDKPSLQRVYADRTGISENSADVFSRRNRRVLLMHHVENLQTWWDGLPEGWRTVLREINPDLNREIPTVEILAYTVGMDSLDLSGSEIKTLGPVLKFRKINYLKFDDTEIQDLNPLADMKTLNHISGRNTQVKSLQALSNLNELTHIDFSKTEVNSIEVLHGLEKLEYLNVDATAIEEDEVPVFMEINPDLHLIYRSSILENWYDNLEERWKDVLKSYFNSNDDPDMETLHVWTSSPRLSIERSSISTLRPLLIFVNLRELNVFNVPVTDFSVLSQMTLLRELSIVQSPFTDLSVLRPLEELRVLDLSSTGIDDLRPISNLKSIEELKLAGTNIKVLRGLEGFNNLKQLDISNTNVRNLKQVQGLGSLEKLVCFNTRINKRIIDLFRRQNPDCEVLYY
ncbi:leucine-rich repeat domain-containing protein [Arthrospiribacter ruber]|uniref:Leucine-rich repeat domain-containing protein n=1 Tax=Arthrospiribacter ruber TaxID=2487934 RepID=A0A951IYB9_9BACT|nr:leucine-rich repeat domain-containing protein [Arthrospiribacter ruber]MBW3468524.1 leucine-rich repeat domain-containing protein [Arthrospiribacter ruber]